MSGIKILPNFVVNTGGVMSLRVVTLDFLRRKGFDPTTGFGFSKEQSDRYGGKKLKLYKVYSDPDCVQCPGATRRLSFSSDGDDTYQWNEYMFQEYWDAIGQGEPARAPANPKPATVKRPATPARAEQTKASAPVPQKRKTNGMLKMLILMSLLNQSKATPVVTAKATPPASDTE